ncbi:hypothetical protein [Maliponia aquimaris]|uniref:hypothetical protein n=1 Tax=Maliponia aquimaris TaxID=1673631 RepID=UPI0011405C71|nr:hypothetical protein [Maliponia aquimaris]
MLRNSDGVGLVPPGFVAGLAVMALWDRFARVFRSNIGQVLHRFDSKLTLDDVNRDALSRQGWRFMAQKSSRRHGNKSIGDSGFGSV